MVRPQQEEDAASTTSSSSMKRSPLAPIVVDGHRTTDDPKLIFSSSYPCVSRSHSDDELRQRPSLYQRRKSSVPGLSIVRPMYHRRRSHNRRPSPTRNSPAIPSSLTPIHPNFIYARRTSLPALHFHETTKNVAPHQVETPTQQRRDSLSEDMYGALQSFTFGAPPRHISHSTPDEYEDEDERQRRDRAKMRAIDDGTRRPSLPTNSGTPIVPRSQSSLSSLSSAGIVVGERQWDEHSEPDWDIVMGDITPTRATPPNSSSGNVSAQSEPRRPPIPIAIPMLRRRSRSADELAVDFEQRIHGSTATQPTLPTSTPLFSWVPRHHSPDVSKGVSSSPEENAYDGYDLNFILSQNPASIDSHDSHLKHQSSSGLLRGKFRTKTKNAAQSRFEDTFMRHIMDSDPIHRQRQAEWTFRQELTPTHPIHASKNKDKDRTARLSEDSEGWRCEWVGRFTVYKIRSDHRHPQSTSDSSKGPYNRLQIMHCPDPDNKGNKLGGPRVLVHRHSRAQAFSIFRAHNIHPKKAMIPTDSVLLAVKAVLREYTRTESTRALKTYGLMDDRSSRSHVSHHGSGNRAPERHPSRTTKNSNTQHERSSVVMNASNSQRSPTSSANSRSTSQSSEARSRKISTRNTPPNNVTRLNTTAVSPPRPSFLALNESSDAPHATAISSSLEYVPPTSQWDPPSPRLPRLSTSHAEAFAMIDPDARDFDWYHHRNDSGPFPSFSSGRIGPSQAAPLPPASIPSPPNIQRSAIGIGELLKRAFSSSKPQQQHQKEPGSPVTDDGEDEPKMATQDGKFAPPWLTVARRSEKEQHERMIRTLNDSFESVGLIPPQDKKKTGKPRMHKGAHGEESVLDEVPEDSMCMLLPLWPEESDLRSQPRSQGLSRQSSRTVHHASTQSMGYATVNVPLEDRKFLLVYYANQLPDNPDSVADHGIGNNKKRRRPQTAGERPHHASQSASQGPFYAAGRLLTYDNVRSSGVRLPGKGLSVNGTLADAAMGVPVPSPFISSSDGFEVIAVCQGPETGVSLIHEGLVKLGLVDPQDNDESAKLSEIGRAVVEMVWCGCISLMLFTP